MCPLTLKENDIARRNRDRLSSILNLYATKLDQKQAEANDRHAKAMKGLTWALLIAAAAQAVGTAVSVMIQLGIF